VNGRRGGEELARLIERSAELKRDLVDFACSPRFSGEVGVGEFDSTG